MFDSRQIWSEFLNHVTSFRSDTRGAALIEATLILPLLLVVVFGMADIALYFWQMNSAQKAVQLGARKAIVADSIAVGGGLTAPESVSYWNGLPLGARCVPEADGRSVCPVFSVTCNVDEGCICQGAGCSFALARPRLTPIFDAMRAILPQLNLQQIEVTYATNYLGYVGRPIPVPVNVTVKIRDLRYNLIFLGNVMGQSIPITAAVTLPGEYMAPNSLD